MRFGAVGEKSTAAKSVDFDENYTHQEKDVL
jgi:hypothetical protein